LHMTNVTLSSRMCIYDRFLEMGSFDDFFKVSNFDRFSS